MTDKELVSAALAARENAYAPYSGFRVGAALMTAEGKIYTGCNIENAAYGPTVCAERTAFFKAVSEGERNFAKIAIAGGKEGEITSYAYPCGVCRQVMSEFCGPDFEITVAKSPDDFEKHTLGELLPYGFSAENME